MGSQNHPEIRLDFPQCGRQTVKGLGTSGTDKSSYFYGEGRRKKKGVCYKSNNIVGVQKVKEKAMMQYKVELESRDWTRFGCFHLGFLSKG